MEDYFGAGMTFENEKLNFPLECHYKIIAEDIQNMAFVIETVLRQLHVFTPVEPGNKSAKGKYVTYNITVMVQSQEKMNEIDAALRNIAGVRMVL